MAANKTMNIVNKQQASMLLRAHCINKCFLYLVAIKHLHHDQSLEKVELLFLTECDGHLPV